MTSVPTTTNRARAGTGYGGVWYPTQSEEELPMSRAAPGDAQAAATRHWVCACALLLSPVKSRCLPAGGADSTAQRT